MTNYDRLSTAGSITSTVDKDLISKFDDKRKAKYNVLKDLQALDSGIQSSFLYPNLCVDETGKYKTNKCSAEMFFFTCQKHGIEVNDQIREGVRGKVLPGS